ncbi:FAD-dependent oxidoreductase [Actinocrispum wychmicini]|uniref:Assimilatory nitrate reductase electron transfer subunit n=1 Tax=Actinocrispum wychmicini TaxID=1213861 RepID=A0A4V2S754_9PSEU|nr:FAD-dependent oxidoreductase [Actinocrispum wychmicini]TCO58660.1 assimilatory nitrate reductase electron transfer subunit [Actinocrispum wychmicini]
MRSIVIVGYGMAGARLAEEISRRDPGNERVSVTVLGEEPHPAYNRVLLSGVVAGSMKVESITLHGPEWEDRVRIGVSATAIDRGARKVTLSDGSTISYDALVLATGSRAWLPPVAGLTDDSPSVVAFRTLGDCERILAGAAPGAPVAVLGGGLLGIEAARGLVGRGCQVTVVHPVGHLMERQLDPGGGAVLRRRLSALGVETLLDAKVMAYVPGDGLQLADGLVPADMVVVAAGVKPETSLAAAAGIRVDRGIVVDDCLRTSDPRVYSIGDCAQHPGTVSGLVQSAWDQAAVLADLLTGVNVAARYRGTPVVTRLKARDMDVAALGEVHVGIESEDAEVLCLSDPERGRYAKLVIRHNRVAGAILIGAPDAAATITQLYDADIPVPSDRLAVLLGRALPVMATVTPKPAELPAGAVVCRCNSVSKAQLVTAWRSGATSESELASATRATTGCGSCREAVCGIAEWLSATT